MSQRFLVFFAAIVLFLLLGLASPLTAATYHVGPGQDHTELDTIDWPNLMAGDEVAIHWRNDPYRTKIGLRSRGTETNPIRIYGLRGPGGERPVIDGENATTPASLNGFFSPVWDEFLGTIIIKRGPGDPWGHKPGFIEISNLEIRGANPTNSYTAMDGSTQTYADGAAAVWAVLVENLDITHCEITDNGNGLFVLSKNDEEEVSRDVLIAHNHIHHNGVSGSFRQHEIYTQVASITFEYNRIGPLRDGATGSSLKDRSANTVIRYNWIESGARTLDLVDPEDSYNILTLEPGFNDTWVYGNVLMDRYSTTQPYATSLIHYGGDTGVPAIYRKGMLHFYHNTLYLEFAQTQAWNLQLFDLSTNEESVELYNNIFYLNGDSNLHLARQFGHHELGANNWINDTWIESRDGFQGTVTVTSPPLIGTSPGLANPAALDFSVPAGAQVHDTGLPLPGHLGGPHPVNQQYVEHLGRSPRITEGPAVDLGAYEHFSLTPIFADGFESGDSSAWSSNQP